MLDAMSVMDPDTGVQRRADSMNRPGRIGFGLLP
jgi:hypothetical protein